MSDGRVVLVGGTTGGGTNVEAIEVFDPEANTFSVKATARRLPAGDFQAFDISNGRILLYGGYNTDGPTIVDTTNWTTRVISTDQSHFRQCVAGLKLPDGKIMLSGGSWWYGSATDTKDYDDILVFDPATETFATAGKMSITRCGHSMLLLPDGKVGIYGGVESSLTGGVWSPKVEVFDPVTGKSTTTNDLVRAIYDANSTLLQDGHALHVGGWQNGSTISNAQIIYDHATGTSGYTGAMTVARSNFTMTTLNNGLILLAGGTGNGVDSDNVGKVHDTAEIFDPQSAIYLILAKGAVPVGDPTPIDIEARATGPVVWTATLGSIDGNGRYTAPPSVAEDTHNPTDTITATLVSDPSKKANAFVTLLTDAVTISSPASSVAPGGTLQLSAKVAQYDDQRVQWGTTGGTIDETGLLTAPATPGRVVVKATSVANPAQTAQFGLEVK